MIVKKNPRILLSKKMRIMMWIIKYIKYKILKYQNIRIIIINIDK